MNAKDSPITFHKETIKDISIVFVEGFNPQKLFGVENFKKWIDGTSASWLVIFILFLLASMMNILASFVLFSAGFLFIVRIAILWLVMIFAPLAFVAMALPYTDQYAKKWRTALFSQSFFAPVYLFLFYLVAKLVGEDFLKSIGTSLVANEGLQSFLKSILIVFIHFAVLSVLMMACLIVAKQMGAYGAGTAEKWGTIARKWGQGKAKRYSMRGAGFASEKALSHAYDTDEEGKYKNKWFGAVLRGGFKIPTATRGAARMSSWRERQIEETKKKREKTYGSYSEAGLAALNARKLVTRPRREVIEEKLEGKQKADKEKVEIKKLKNERKGLKLREKSENWDEGRKKIQDKIEVHKKTNKLEYGSPGSWEREMEKLDNEMAEFMKSTYDKINGINSKLNKKKENAIIGEAQKLIKKAQSGGGGEAPKLAPKTEKA